MNRIEPVIGVIGLGDMGKLYARKFSASGLRVLACDLPENFDRLEGELRGTGIELLPEAREVCSRSDMIIYSVPTGKIRSSVAESSSFIRPGSIVSGQCAVKTVETQAFDAYLSQGNSIIPCHSMHGPSVDPRGQKLLVIRHRADDEDFARASAILGRLGSELIPVPSAEQHDRMTADIQALTHICFQSMATAWARMGSLPWELPRYGTPIDMIKIWMALRIFSGKPHVYSELAMLNPYSRSYISEYANSVDELNAMFRSGRTEALFDRIRSAGQDVFPDPGRKPLFEPAAVSGIWDRAPLLDPNTNLSILAMVDCWHRLGVRPEENLICRTPPYLLRVGIAENVTRDLPRIEARVAAMIKSESLLAEDALFSEAVSDWTRCILDRDQKRYEDLFQEVRTHFQPHLREAVRKSDQIIESTLRALHGPAAQA